MQKYKVDWLAFSVSFDEEEQTLDPQLMKILGYDLLDFDEIPGSFSIIREPLTEIMLTCSGTTPKDLGIKTQVEQ